MNNHKVHHPVLHSLALQIRKCAPRKAKWLTNDIKINRFWLLNPSQKVIARILISTPFRQSPQFSIKTIMHVVNLCVVISHCTEELHKPVNSPRERAESAGSGCTRGRRHLWFETWGAGPPGHKRGGLTRTSVSQICRPQGDLESAGPYLTMGLSADLNFFQTQ